jgi:hypothetical protein
MDTYSNSYSNSSKKTPIQTQTPCIPVALEAILTRIDTEPKVLFESIR